MEQARKESERVNNTALETQADSRYFAKNKLQEGVTYRLLNIYWDSQGLGQASQTFVNGIRPFIYAEVQSISGGDVITIYCPGQMSTNVIPVKDKNFQGLLSPTINKNNLELKKFLHWTYNGLVSLTDSDNSSKRYHFTTSLPPADESAGAVTIDSEGVGAGRQLARGRGGRGGRGQLNGGGRGRSGNIN